jgi:uroporphyrinogen III methyltransferase/synthase
MPDGLRDKRVLVTRATGQNVKLSQQLASVGAVPVEFPTIQIGPPTDPTPLNTAIANLANYQWLILTSANGVKYFWQYLLAAGKDTSDLRHLRVAAIGPATATEIRERGLTIDVIPTEHVAEMLVAAMPLVAGQRILLPTANIARDALVDGLTAKGAIVERVTAYQNTSVTNPDRLPNLLPTLDALTFTSASTARNFANLLQPKNPTTVIGPAVVACIGPITADAAIDAGLPVHVVAQTYTVPGLVEALQQYFERTYESAS